MHYAYDTVALSKGAAGAIVEGGAKTWFFLTADYAFGHAMEADASKVVKDKGGTVVNAVRHPLNASDFSSFLLQAQNSKAQVLALANAGGTVAVAVTGIAGPGGGSADKPVGTVWIGWKRRGGYADAKVCHFEGDRDAVRRQTVAAALRGLEHQLA